MIALSNIPIAIFNNIVLMGLCWIIFQLIIRYTKFGASLLFNIAFSFQIIAAIKFILDLVKSTTPIYTYPTLYTIQLFNFPLNDPSIILGWMGIGYFIILCCLLVRMMLQMNSLTILKSSANFNESAKWKKELSQLTINKQIHFEIGFSDKVGSPIVFGYFEPIILLPIAFCNSLSIEQVKYILIHEMAHILRKDYLMNVFIETVKTILWFNPFSYLFYDALQLQREIACDSIVIKYTQAPVPYSKALYKLALSTHLRTYPFSLAALQSKNDLLYRIETINQIPTKANHINKLILSIGVLAIICFPFLSFQRIPKTLIASKFVNEQFYIKQPIKIIYKALAKNSLMHNKLHQSKLTPETLTISPLLNEENIAVGNLINTQNDQTSYNRMINETKMWIKAHENPIQFANYNELNDSLENKIAERLLIQSILKNYQLKRALLAQRIESATDAKEATDFIMNSTEWEEMVQYQKWLQSFLNKQ